LSEDEVDQGPGRVLEAAEEPGEHGRSTDWIGLDGDGAARPDAG
jgi:hypothetical protein